jgi:hypothetical protein
MESEVSPQFQSWPFISADGLTRRGLQSMEIFPSTPLYIERICFSFGLYKKSQTFVDAWLIYIVHQHISKLFPISFDALLMVIVHNGSMRWKSIIADLKFALWHTKSNENN